jgi:hypothetical protein
VNGQYLSWIHSTYDLGDYVLMAEVVDIKANRNYNQSCLEVMLHFILSYQKGILVELNQQGV